MQPLYQKCREDHPSTRGIRLIFSALFGYAKKSTKQDCQTSREAYAECMDMFYSENKKK